jgi:hypothetical protein
MIDCSRGSDLEDPLFNRIKDSEKTLISRGLYKINFEQQTYYLKKIKSKLEYNVGKELGSLRLKEFLIPDVLFVEKQNDKKPICKHIYKKDEFYMLTKEMKGIELDIVITKITDEEFRVLIQRIIDVLEIAWNEIQFVHGDLHLRNIFVHELEPMIFDFEHSSIRKRNPKMTFKKDLWIFLTNLALNTKNEKSEIVMQFVDRYFNEREKFQESLYACLPML